jgi:hypothetical protein
MVVVCGASAVAVAGPGGTAEVRLSPEALEELVAPATERTVPFRFSGFGEVRLKIGRAEDVKLTEGAVEARVPVSVAPSGLEGGLRVQLVPEIDPETGRLMLRSVRARGEGALAGMPDLAQALPTVELPRGLEQIVTLEQAPPFRLSVYLQGVDIDPEGVELRFLVKTGPATPEGGR